MSSISFPFWPSDQQGRGSFLFPPGAKEILSGTFAGLVGTVIGQPLDLVKVRLQTQNQYKGALDCLIKVAKNEGIKNGLYRGLIPPLISLTFLNSLSFGAYSQFKKKLVEMENSVLHKEIGAHSWLHPHYFIAGGLTGTLSGVFSTPFEMVKVRMQLDNISEKKYRGSLQCASSLLKTYGVKAWYTGYTVNTVREATFCTCYFGTYEHLKSLLSTHIFTGYNSSIAIMIAGGLSGMSAWFISFPLDCIKANIQGQCLDSRFRVRPDLPPRKTFLRVVREIWATRGLTGFYSGVGPSVMRAFIVSSTRFSAYEFAYYMLTKYIEQRPVP